MLGGRGTGGAGADFRAAVAFVLDIESPLSEIIQIAGWEIELEKGSKGVVARTAQPMAQDRVLPEGLDHVEKALDLLAYEKHAAMMLEDHTNSYTALTESRGRLIVEINTQADFDLGFNTLVQVRNAAGEIVPDPPRPPPVLIRALRYYRQSQASQTPQEAYRHLWLGLEALLSHLCPKRGNEREDAWLRRSLGLLTPGLNLTGILPAGRTNIVKYVLEDQYRDMRCNLFHAKQKPGAPAHVMPDNNKAQEAYAPLLRIWRTIAEGRANVRSAGGGAVTNAGFQIFMSNAFDGTNAMECTDDVSPNTVSDTQMSPQGRPVLAFDRTEFNRDFSPGRVAITGFLDATRVPAGTLLHRIGTKMEGTLFSVIFLHRGLSLEGVDELKVMNVFRLRNTKTPRLVF